MPFTLFHLGPALFLGIPLRKYIHAPTFILANVILDVEPLIVMLLRLHYPLHGYLHTFIAAIGVGITFGLVMFLLERPMHPLYKRLLLEPPAMLKKSQFITAGVLGAILHVLFDAPLYYDVKPFSANSKSSLWLGFFQRNLSPKRWDGYSRNNILLTTYRLDVKSGKSQPS